VKLEVIKESCIWNGFALPTAGSYWKQCCYFIRWKRYPWKLRLKMLFSGESALQVSQLGLHQWSAGCGMCLSANLNGAAVACSLPLLQRQKAGEHAGNIFTSLRARL
jgi:hypothetical protein